MAGTRNCLIVLNNAKMGKTKGHLVSPALADCLTCAHEEEGFKQGTVEHAALEMKMAFQHRVVLRELMHAMLTARSDIACSVTTRRNFQVACQNATINHWKVSQDIFKQPNLGESGPKDQSSDDPPDSNCQESALLPEAAGEFTVNAAQFEPTGLVDASHGSEL